MKYKIFSTLVLIAILLSIPGSALAQDYYFRLDKEVIHVYWNEDGSMSLDYVMEFYNDPSGHSIEYVDLGLPNYSYDLSSIQADVNGHSVSVSSSDYEGSGSGVAVVLGGRAIPAGQTGTVHVYVSTVSNVLNTDTTDSEYASAVFGTSWFGSAYVYGSTDMTVVFHLPPGVQPDEPRWHSSPSGDWPSEPDTKLDSEGRIAYIWHNPDANGHTQYKFGASFPKSYVPESAIYSPGFLERLGISEDDLMSFMCCGGIIGLIALVTWGSVVSTRKRKMQYLPPKIRIEGHGIKRGLTAIEAAILMERPMDKILTMILFAVLKKEAATVIKRDPLTLEIADPLPENLRPYEEEFIQAFAAKRKDSRRKQLREVMIKLIKGVSKKLKGFSHKESVAYYRKIMERAWQQVEAADTPEVKSQQFDENMGWTMLDKDFDDRTQDVFRTGPVFVPMWWGRYDPGWSRSGSVKIAPKVVPASIGGGRSATSMPSLPGGEFAASMVTGIQGFSSDVVGSVTDFTSSITNKTNPVPKSSSSSGGYRSSGGSSCACACAGCACACAGGGR